MTMIEVFIGANSLALVAGVIVLARLASRIGRAADNVGRAARSVEELTPGARALIETGRVELEGLRLLRRTTTAVAEDVRAVTGQASEVTSQLLRGFETGVFARYRAVFAGARAGIDVLRRLRGGNGSGETLPDEMEEFDLIYNNEQPRRKQGYGKQ